MVSRTVGLLQSSLPDIYDHIWERQDLRDREFLRKSVNAAQLPTQLIVHVQLLNHVDEWVRVKLDVLGSTGEGVLKVRLR